MPSKHMPNVNMFIPLALYKTVHHATSENMEAEGPAVENDICIMLLKT